MSPWKTFCLVSLVLALAIVPRTAAAAPAGDAPHMTVTATVPNVPTFDVEGIVVSSFANATVPSPGPIDVNFTSSNGTALGWGCAACNLSQGVWATSVVIHPDLGEHTIFVTVRDLATNVTGTVSFTTFYPESYLETLREQEVLRHLAQANATFAAQQAALQDEGLWIVASLVVAGVAIIAWRSHKYARTDPLRQRLSWKDEWANRIGVQGGGNPLSKAIREEDNGGTLAAPAWIERQYARRLERGYETFLRQLFAVYDQYLEVLGEEKRLTKLIQEVRAAAGATPEPNARHVRIVRATEKVGAVDILDEPLPPADEPGPAAPSAPEIPEAAYE